MYKLGLLLIICLSNLIYVQGKKGSLLSSKDIKKLREAPLVQVSKEALAKLNSTDGNLVHTVQKCNCEELSCECCVIIEISLFSIKGCFNITYSPTDDMFNITITAGRQVVFNFTLPVYAMEKTCHEINIIRDETFKFCIYATVYGKEPEFTACISIDVHYKIIKLLNINFECLDFVKGKLRFTGNKKTIDYPLANIRIKKEQDLILKLVQKVTLQAMQIKDESSLLENSNSSSTSSNNTGGGSSNNTRSNNTGSNNTSSNNTGSNNTSSNNTGSNNTSSNNTGSSNTSSNNTSSNNNNTSSNNTGSNNTGSNNTSSSNASSNNTKTKDKKNKSKNKKVNKHKSKKQKKVNNKDGNLLNSFYENEIEK